MSRSVRSGETSGWDDLRPTEDPNEESSDNPWAWIATSDDGAQVRLDVSGVTVTAVLVALDGARWLPYTLEGLSHLENRPARLIAIDNDSSDATLALLEEARDLGIIDAIYSGKRSFGFGTAVKSALRQDRTRLDPTPVTSTGTADPRPADSEWLWLLHDDAVPAPDALHHLLAHVVTDSSIDITGPKLVLPKRRHGGQPISEIGVSISGTGRRELTVDTDEIDQGQRDQPRERLGVSTCGMLVRSAVWRDLDGLDPALPVFRDGVEFGWRAHLNGYRVVTTPTAMMIHRQVGRAGLRPHGLTGRRPGRVDRLLGMLVVAGHAPGKMLPLVWLRLVGSCLLHAVAYLFGKIPGRALDELLALGSFVTHPGRIAALRTRTAEIDPAPGTGEVVQALRPPWWDSIRVAAESVGSVVSERYREVAGEADAASLDELTGDDFSSVTDDRPKYPWLNPIVIATVVAVVASVAAARSLIGLGFLAAPALLPAHGTLSGLWRAVLAPIPGAPGQVAPPWLGLMAVGSTVLAGQPEWFSTLLICGVVPLALLTSYPVIRRLVNDRRLRLWVASTYALLPVLLGGTNQGRLTLSIFAIMLPLLVAAARAVVLRRVRTAEAWRGGWGAAVVLVVMASFEPSVLLPVLIVAGLGAVTLRRTPRKIGRIGIALGIPLLVFAPWLPSLIREPGRLFASPDAGLGGVTPAPAVWRLLMGSGLGPGLPPIWVGFVVFGVIWVLAALGLVRRPDRRAVLTSWIVAVLAFAMAVVLSRMVVAVPPVDTEIRPWVGAYLLTGFAALLLGGGVGVDGLSTSVARRSFTWLQPLTVLASVAIGVVTVGGGVWWVLGGAQGPIERTKLNAIPTYVLNAMATEAKPRVLAVDLSGPTVRYSVLDHGPVRLGDVDRGLAFGGSTIAPTSIDDLVVRLVAGTADSDIGPQLSELGIGYVWVNRASTAAVARIDNTPGLGVASGSGVVTVWQLDPPVSRATITGQDGVVPVGTLPVRVEGGFEARQLRLGEAADPRWIATIDGRELEPVEVGWQQGFSLPAGGGTVTYELPTYAPWLVAGQGVVLLIAGVLAAPGVRRPEVRDPTKTARRAATLSETV